VLAVGLMSGTSLDGIDAALVDLRPRGGSYATKLLAFETTRFDAAFLKRIRAALPPRTPSPAAVSALDRDLGAALADAARRVAGEQRIDFVASHGLTLYHDGAAHLTCQIGDPYALRERLDATVIYDFRRADCAVDGEGAPLMPYIDALLLGSDIETRVALNLGGIANVSILRPGVGPNDVLGFDTGPGNMLLDAFVRYRTENELDFDYDGLMARSGNVDQELLDEMLQDPFFWQRPPKSTGREHFGEQFLAAHDDKLQMLSVADGCATLTELTARTIADAAKRIVPPPAAVIVSGGGTHNRTLVERIGAAFGEGFALRRSSEFGLPVDAKEALAFAVLGYETLREREANVPAVTGARRRVILGTLAPQRLRALLAKVIVEVSEQ
jgi:anhydro-N-acetylmuramic acid kinase